MEFSGHTLDQRVLLEDFRLRLDVGPIRISTQGRRGIDIAQVKEILVDSLDLKRSLGFVQAGLGEANEGRSEYTQTTDPH